MPEYDFSIIQFLRQRYFMSRQQLAEKCGVSRQTISNIEQGRFVPSLPVIMQICGALDLKYGELISYCRRMPTRLIEGESVVLPDNAGRAVLYSLSDKALAYIELNAGVSYVLKKYQVQCIYVIEGSISISCCCGENDAIAGDLVTLEGVGCRVDVKKGPARIVAMSLPGTNGASQLMFAGRKSGVNRFFNFNETSVGKGKDELREFDFSIIRDLRKARGFIQEDFLARCSLTAQTLQSIERNDRCPGLPTLDLIAEALDVELVDMLELARRGSCQVNQTRLATFGGKGGEQVNVDMALNQMRYDKYRMGYLNNGTGQNVEVPSENVYIAQEEFVFVVAGNQSVMVGDTEYKLKADKGLLFDGRGVHSYKIAPGNESFAIFTLKQDALYNGPVDQKTGGTLYKFGDVLA
ncbi:MAG: helix-turn-helix domain-containing protein [Sedimentisphaerales bacterium]|nr:helix-turn-helix domain-containing protein [Sedimentisphaerales bacterium]